LANNSIAIIALTRGGRLLAARLANLLPDSRVLDSERQFKEVLTRAWHQYDCLLCIMATGIVVRSLAPLLKDKKQDPAVVVCDEQGRFAISLLSGHLGGANAFARQVADLLQGQAVITTASDVLGHTALDLWAQELNLTVADRQAFTRTMARLVNSGAVCLRSDYPLPPLPADIRLLDNEEDPAAATPDLWITCRTDCQAVTLLHPKALVAGIGCNRNTPEAEIEQALAEACADNQLALESVLQLASIDLKNDEPGLLAFAEHKGYTLSFFNRDQLNGVDGVSTSAAVLKATGAKGVAEPAAVLASNGGRLLVKKMKWRNVTVALAEIACPWE
jgi:cobalt-precorrin 5A hydrolase